MTNQILYWAIYLLSDLCARLPARWALALGDLAGDLAFLLNKRKRNAYADLKAAFGDRYSEKERWGIIRRHFRNLAKTGMEIIRFPSLSPAYVESHVVAQHRERFFQAVEEGRGVVLLTAHFGNWELLQIVSSLIGKPIYVLARNQEDVRLNDMLNRLRQSHGSVAVTRGMGVRGLYRALKKGELVGLLGDQDAGKFGGILAHFFGRKTTVPTGAFEMARRSGSPILPCYDVRLPDGRHEIRIGEAIRCGKSGDVESDIAPAIRRYLDGLEAIIHEYPDHWLWGSKRWKYSWTKQILVLSDGKRGHEKQSEALADVLREVREQHGREGMEYTIDAQTVRFRSPWHQKFFYTWAFFMMPWIQGRLGCLRFFLEPSCADALRNTRADFVISAGASLVPLNRCLAKESCAKSIVLMKPSFPYDLFKYDLAVIPAHDHGRIPREHFRTLITPSLSDPAKARSDATLVSRRLRTGHPVKTAVFLGGQTRNFSLDLGEIEKLITILERHAKKKGAHYAISTSRRTPEGIERFLKAGYPQWKGCELLVIASEDPSPEIAGGLMTIADQILVTEDSISMVSEAIAARKKVMVLTFPKKGLSSKHYRFHRILHEREAAIFSSSETLEGDLEKAEGRIDWGRLMAEERNALKKRLEAIL